MKITAKMIAEIDARTVDAFSRDRYVSWPALVRALLLLRYTPVAVETILLSKIPRWAADASPAGYGRASARDLVRHVKRHPADVLSLLKAEGLAS